MGVLVGSKSRYEVGLVELQSLAVRCDILVPNISKAAVYLWLSLFRKSDVRFPLQALVVSALLGGKRSCC
jgi:hypothetical protein